MMQQSQRSEIVDQLKNLGYVKQGESMERKVQRDGSTISISFDEAQDEAIVERVNSKERILSHDSYKVRTPVQMSTFLTAVA